MKDTGISMVPMRIVMSQVVVAALLVTGTPVVAQTQAAPSYPSKAVRIIVPFGAGGGVDIIARLVGRELSDSWGQSVVVDNRGGGGGVVGVQIAAKSTPDGHTMLLSSLGYSNAPAMHAKPPYDAEKDLMPISLVATQPFVYVVVPTLGVTSMKELVAMAKSKPHTIRYGSAGTGGASHLGTEFLRMIAGIDLVHVPYKGLAQALTGMLGGEIHVQLVGVAVVLPYIKTGRVHALAVSGAKRSPALPEVPTVVESGIPDYVFDVWYGMMVPAGTPRAIVNKIKADIHRVLKAPVLTERFASLGMDPAPTTPEYFSKLIRSEIVKWNKVVRGAEAPVQ